MGKTKAMKLAIYECQQWYYHHKKNKIELKKAMAQYFELLGVSPKQAKIAAQLTFEAFGFHDKAELCKKKEEANVYWCKAIDCLTKRNMMMLY